MVVIPTYNERDNIEKLLREILHQGNSIETLVVDDNSPDGTGAIVIPVLGHATWHLYRKLVV